MCESCCYTLSVLKIKLENLIAEWEKTSSKLSNAPRSYAGEETSDYDKSITLDLCIDELQKILDEVL